MISKDEAAVIAQARLQGQHDHLVRLLDEAITTTWTDDGPITVEIDEPVPSIVVDMLEETADEADWDFHYQAPVEVNICGSTSTGKGLLVLSKLQAERAREAETDDKLAGMTAIEALKRGLVMRVNPEHLCSARSPGSQVSCRLEHEHQSSHFGLNRGVPVHWA